MSTYTDEDGNITNRFEPSIPPPTIARLFPPPAAGPWRTDVENAPKDGTRFIGEFDYEDEGFWVTCAEWKQWTNNTFGWQTDLGIRGERQLRAFAAINPPEPRP